MWLVLGCEHWALYAFLIIFHTGLFMSRFMINLIFLLTLLSGTLVCKSISPFVIPCFKFFSRSCFVYRFIACWGQMVWVSDAFWVSWSTGIKYQITNRDIYVLWVCEEGLHSFCQWAVQVIGQHIIISPIFKDIFNIVLFWYKLNEEIHVLVLFPRTFVHKYVKKRWMVKLPSMEARKVSYANFFMQWFSCLLTTSNFLFSICFRTALC